MRLKKVKGADIIVGESDYIIKEPKNYKSKWREVFENDNPIHIEIGMGKGNFIIGMAEKYSNINFIGIEMYDSVLVRAVQKLDEREKEIPNLRLIKMDATEIEEVFEKEVSLIYLNFSDPWPKKRHTKRRLTSKEFLERYDSIFKNEKIIFQKTDNNDLFEFSMESLQEYGYNLKNVTRDLHSENIQDNVQTEYEEKFSSNGVKINRLEAYKNS